MPAEHVINVDLARVWSAGEKKRLLRILSWGDSVEVIAVTDDHVEVRTTEFKELPDGSIKPQQVPGFIRPPKNSGIKPADVVLPRHKNKVLQVAFVDVQQGDGAIIETPQGKVVLIDGGDNQLFARYLAGRFRGTTETKPKEIDCILVTHGDADHFQGLVEIRKSEKHTTEWKRLFIHPQRVYHNGLIKRPSKRDGRKVSDIELLGPTETLDGAVVLTPLVNNLLDVPDAEMNKPFREWKEALQTFQARGSEPIQVRRLAMGDDDAFDFLAQEGLQVKVLGPLLTRKGDVEGLKFLGNPRKGPRLGEEALSLEEDGFSGFSASHTINGHSVVLHLTYGGFTFLLAGDLNDEAERALTRAHKKGDLSLQADVFKVPHHGSADFSAAFLQAVAPVVSVVSSGDESARKEYIHPRATLMGALGRFSRVEEPLVFVTELVAFFEMQGFVRPEFHALDKQGVCQIKDNQAVLDPKAAKRFFAFKRTAFGMVRVHTDGKRMLVYTNSGQAKLKEAYAYQAKKKGPVPVPVRQA